MDDPSKFCKAMDAWAKACMTDLPTDDEYKKKWREKFRDAWGFIRLSIGKSCLLDRLIYGGETIRTEMCPVHQGHWSGCTDQKPPPGCNCYHGICVTGWQKNRGDVESENSGLAIMVEVPKE